MKSIKPEYGGKINFPTNSPPTLIVISGPARTGTTALANTFAKEGYQAHMQPIKSARRAKETGEQVVSWEIVGHAPVVTKETLGPTTPAEFFNPMEIMIASGYPSSRLVFIPIVREPCQAFASWEEKWGQNTVKFEEFVRAYECTAEACQATERAGIMTIPYVHELISKWTPPVVIGKLFELLGLPKPNMTEPWGRLKESENVVLYDDPPERFVDQIHRREKYVYRPRTYDDRLRQLVNSVPRLNEIHRLFRAFWTAKLPP